MHSSLLTRQVRWHPSQSRLRGYRLAASDALEPPLRDTPAIKRKLTTSVIWKKNCSLLKTAGWAGLRYTREILISCNSQQRQYCNSYGLWQVNKLNPLLTNPSNSLRHIYWQLEAPSTHWVSSKNLQKFCFQLSKTTKWLVQDTGWEKDGLDIDRTTRKAAQTHKNATL